MSKTYKRNDKNERNAKQQNERQRNIERKLKKAQYYNLFE